MTLNSDGSFTYTPESDFFGVDSFTYRATDGDLQSQTVTVQITVNAQPDAPNAVDDAFTAPNDGTQQTFDVLANDTSDPDEQQTLTLESVTQGAEGGVVSISNGQILYTAPQGFIGQETFTYTIEDTDGLTSTATVTVTVEEPANNAVSGFVYIDADGDGQRDAGEVGVPGVLVTLSGTDNSNNPVSLEVLTGGRWRVLLHRNPGRDVPADRNAARRPERR